MRHLLIVLVALALGLGGCGSPGEALVDYGPQEPPEVVHPPARASRDPGRGWW